MIKTRRMVAVAAAAIMATSILAGCAKKTVAPTSGQAETKKVKLTFATNRTDLADTKIKELTDSYTKANPNVTIEIEALKDPDSVLKTRAAAGELPDVTLIPGTLDLRDYGSYFEPLDDLGYNDSNLHVYKKGLGTDGKLYGLNSAVSYEGIVYNKKAFKDAGIDKVPTTLDELYAACEKLKAKGIIPLASNFKDKWPLKWYAAEYVYAVANTNNPNYKNDTIKGDLFKDDNGLLAGFKVLRTMQEKKYLEPDLMSTNWEQMKKDHAAGKIAMAYLGTWYLPQMADSGAAKEDIGMFPFPGTKSLPQSGDWTFGVAKNSKNVKEAKAFLKWMWEDSRYANAIGVASPLKSAKSDDKAIAEVTSFKLPFISTDSNPATPDYLEATKKFQVDLNDVLQEYLIAKDPDSVIKKYNEKWSAAIKK